MATATFSGHSGYELDATATRSGKSISVTVKVRRIGTYEAFSTAQQSWAVSIENQVQNDSWTYDFRAGQPTEKTLGTKTRANLATGQRYWVVTVNMASGIGSATVSGWIDIPPNLPAAPTFGSVTRNSDTSQTITWTRNATAEAPYGSQSVERRTFSTGGWGPWASVNNDETDHTNSGAQSFTDTSTVANRIYQYRVAAFNAAGGAASSTSLLVFTTPSAPGIGAEAASLTTVRATVTRTSPHTELEHELEYSSAGGAWTPLTVLDAGVQEYTWAPPSATTIQVRARAVINSAGDPGDNLASAWALSNTVPLQAPPLAPTSLVPNGVTLDRALASTLGWTYTSGDTSGQTAYEIELKAGAGAYVSTGKISATGKVRLYAADSFTAGVAYQWRVRTWGVHPDPSPWSNPASFSVANAPVTLIQTPSSSIATSRVTTSWTPVAGQTSWQAELLKDSEVVESRSGSTSSSVAFTSQLENESTYTVRVRVQANSLWSAWASKSFTTAFPTPAEPLVDLGWDSARGAVLIDIDNPEGTVKNLATNPSFEASSGGATLPVRTNLATDPLQITNGGQANNSNTWAVTKNQDMPAGNPQGITKGLKTTPQPGAVTSLIGSFYSLDSLQATAPTRHVGVWVYIPGIAGVAQFVGYGPAVSIPENTWVWVTTTTPIPSNVQINFGVERLNGNAATPGTHVAYITGATALSAGIPTEAIWGSHPASGDFTYAWSGAANASTSVQSAVVVATYTSGLAVGVRSTEWSSRGSYSLRQISKYSSAGSAFTDIASSDAPRGLERGKTYVISAKARLAEAVTHTPHISYIVVVDGTYRPDLSQSVYVPKTAGVHDVTMTFTVPAVGMWYVRLQHNGVEGSPDLWWDELIITEGTRQFDYFDGSSAGAAWEGTPNASVSTKADSVANEIYRSYDGSSWELVATDVPLDATISDPEVRLNQTVYYRVLTTSSLQTSVYTEAQTIESTSLVGFWAVGPNFSLSQNLRMNLGDPPGIDFETGLAAKQLHYFAGRVLPVEFAGIARQRSGSASFMVGSIAERDQVIEMSYMPAPHLFRLPDGTLVYASIEPAETHRVDEGFYTVAVPLTEVER